jgi:hypothetical protein
VYLVECLVVPDGATRTLCGDGGGGRHDILAAECAMTHYATTVQARQCIDACQEAGVKVQHSVDARNLHHEFSGRTFDRIIFNFPHTGVQGTKPNQAFLRGFLQSAKYAQPLKCIFSSLSSSTLRLMQSECVAGRRSIPKGSCMSH